MRQGSSRPPPTAAQRRLAVGGALVAMLIYGAQFPASRYSVQHGLDAYNLVALRFVGAAILLLPVLLRAGIRDLGGIGWRRGITIALLAGAPYTLLMLGGLHFAPAGHAALFNPGTVMVLGTVLGALVLRERLGPVRVLGIAAVAVGFLLVALPGWQAGEGVWRGDLLFIASGLSWANFLLLMRSWSLPPLIAAAVIAVLSTLVTPLYLAFAQPITASMLHVALQAVNQGLLNGLVAMALFANTARTLGPAVASLFPPMVPVLGTALAMALLDEWPSPLQAVGFAVALAGMITAALAASGLAFRRTG